MIELHYLGVVRAYQGEKCASQMFATAEAQARAHPKARPGMPVVLEVELGNDRARAIYVGRWNFEPLGFREAYAGRRYEVLMRSATDDEGAADRSATESEQGVR